MRWVLFSFLMSVGGVLVGSDVLVSVAPYKYLVDRISGGRLEVSLIVPEGVSAHSYEPTPKQVMDLGKAMVWFGIGEHFETRLLKALTRQNVNLEYVGLDQGLDLIRDGEGRCKACGSHDLHFWLSPKLLIIQVRTLTYYLSKRFPQDQETFSQESAHLIQELEALDEKLHALLKEDEGKKIFVSHPAYAYFMRAYGLEQVPLEFEGKDPTPKRLTELIQLGKHLGVRRIFVQPQYGQKGARLMAQALDCQVIELNPYQENVMDGLLEIGLEFHAS